MLWILPILRGLVLWYIAYVQFGYFYDAQIISPPRISRLFELEMMGSQSLVCKFADHFMSQKHDQQFIHI